MADGYFQRTALTDDGFAGWVRVEEMRERIAQLPVVGGVYVVLRETQVRRAAERRGRPE